MNHDLAAAPRWVRLWFRGAAIYGVVVLLATFLGPPPPAAALLSQYAFVLTALAFQIVFWIVGGNPVRYRPTMLAGVAEKLAFGVPAVALAGGARPVTTVFGVVDLVLGLGFYLAWRATPRG